MGNRLVAIRKLGENNDEGVPVQALREGAVLCGLSHPNVVKMLDFYVHEGKYNFVFEHFDCNLREHLGKMQDEGMPWMPEDKLKSCLLQILAGLEYCHERRIIHRDIKPDNIFLHSGCAVVKIADFGWSRVMLCEGGGRYTPTVAALWYRPPEILLGDSWRHLQI